MDIREAFIDDMYLLIAMGEIFYKESNFEDGGYDPEKFAKTLSIIFQDGNHHVFILDIESKAAGFIIFDCSRYYTKQPVGHMFLFYVLPSHRSLKTANLLLDAALNRARKEGCSLFYGSSSAGFLDDGRTDKALEAIYKEKGF